MQREGYKMRVVSAETDLAGRFEVVVAADAEPTDLDEALATFLLGLVRKRHGTEASAADQQQASNQAGQESES
jgi:hypothetical protein